MKKQIFYCFVLLLFLFNTFSFSMELCPIVNAYKIDPIVGEFDQKEARKIIHINSLCASDEAKGVIEAILEGHQIDKYSGILFHGPHGTGKTLMAKKMVGVIGGGASLRAQELMLMHYSTDELAQKLQDEDFQQRLVGYNRHLKQLIKENFERPIRKEEQYAYILDEADVIIGYDIKYNDGISPATMVLNCLKRAQEINKKRGRPVIRVFATTNRPEKIPQEIRHFFLNVEIKNPNFDRRVIYFREFIDSMSRNGIDVSECNEEVIERIAKNSKNIAVRQLESVKGHIVSLVYSQVDDQLSLKEEHFKEVLDALSSSFDCRVIYFREFIDSMSRNGVDVSECNEEVIRRIAKSSQKIIAVRLERDLEKVKKHVEALVFSQYGFRLSLKEEHFIEAIGKCCSQISNGLQSSNRPQTLNKPWYKKFSNWFQGVRLRRLVENNTAYSVRTLFARIFACLSIKRIVDCCRSLPKPRSVFFLSGRNNSRQQIQDVPHRQVHDRYTLLGPPLRVMTSSQDEFFDRRCIESYNAPVRRGAAGRDKKALVCF